MRESVDLRSSGRIASEGASVKRDVDWLDRLSVERLREPDERLHQARLSQLLWVDRIAVEALAGIRREEREIAKRAVESIRGNLRPAGEGEGIGLARVSV